MQPDLMLENLRLQREVIELKSLVLKYQHREVLAKIAEAEAEAEAKAAS